MLDTAVFHFPQPVQDTLSIYLKAGMEPVRPSLLPSEFGNFEFLPLQDNGVLFATDSVALESIQAVVQGNAGAFMPPIWIGSALFLLFVVCLVLFSLVVRNAQGTFIDNFRNGLFARQKQVPGHKVQVTTTEMWGEFFMISQTILLVAIFIITFVFTQMQAPQDPTLFMVTFGTVLFGLALLAGIKYLMYRGIAAFFLRGDIKVWIGRYYLHFQLLGLLLFLPVLVFVYLQEYRNIVFIIILFLFFINRIAVIISLLNIFVKNKIGLIYFFSYLCGTEIAPYLLFYKGAISFVNFAGNYLV